jgi:hypothetical protein
MHQNYKGQRNDQTWAKGLPQVPEIEWKTVHKKVEYLL